MKHCPFCGSTTAPQVLNCFEIEQQFTMPGERLTYSVVCDKDLKGCGALGGYHDYPHRAIAAWDRRDNPPAPVLVDSMDVKLQE